MATNYLPHPPNAGPSAPSDSHDLPPPYSAVVGNPQYGFVSPSGEPFIAAQAVYHPSPKSFTAPGVYPHPTIVTNMQPLAGDMPPPAPGISVPVGVVLPVGVGTEPTTITCYSCGKVVTTKVKYTTAWHTHLVAGSICVITTFEVVAQELGKVLPPNPFLPWNYCYSTKVCQLERCGCQLHLYPANPQGWVCSLCCLGLIPYCFDTFKDAEHYCPNCNTFIGKNSKC